MSNHHAPKSHSCVPAMKPKSKASTKRRKEISRVASTKRAEKRSAVYLKAASNLKSEF